MRKFLTSCFALVFICSMFLTIQPVGATVGVDNPEQGNQPVPICHANNGNGTGGFVSESPDAESIVGTHDTHQNGRDIIPVFDYYVWEETTKENCVWGEWTDGKGTGQPGTFEEQEVAVTYKPSHTEHQHGYYDTCPNNYSDYGTNQCRKNSGQNNIIDKVWHVTTDWADGSGGDKQRTRTDEVDVAAHTEHRHLTCTPAVYGWVKHTFTGQNLTTSYDGFTGAEVLANGCKIPTPPTPDPVRGCMDKDATNYNKDATVDNGTCTYRKISICHATGNGSYNEIEISTHGVNGHEGHVDDIIPKPVNGCPVPPVIIRGCMDEDALNYNSEATVDNQSCKYPPVITPTPPTCRPSYDTGANLYQLHMYNTIPEHYGYYVDNGIKMGICQIVTYDGNFPNDTAVRTGCECELPEDFSWVTTSFEIFDVWKTCTGEVFYKNSEGWDAHPFGTFVFGQYCSTAECPLR